MRVSELTFGWLGASAEAPNASASTTFILKTSCFTAACTQAARARDKFEVAIFAHLTTCYAREPVEKPLGGL